MRKYIILALCLLLTVVVAGKLWADATYTSTVNAKSTTADYATELSAITDQTNGYTQRVDSEGAAYVMEKVKEIDVSESGEVGTGWAVTSSAARLHQVIVSGDETAAGCTVLIYDAASATGTAKLDITLGTAKETKIITIPGGAKFSTGIYVKAPATTNTNALANVTVIYDN